MARVACSLMIWMNCRTVASSAKQGSLKSILKPSRQAGGKCSLAICPVSRSVRARRVRAAMSLTKVGSWPRNRLLRCWQNSAIWCQFGVPSALRKSAEPKRMVSASRWPAL